MSNSSFARKISSVSIAAMIFVSACGERDSGPQAGTAHSPSAAERSVAHAACAIRRRPIVFLCRLAHQFATEHPDVR